jgi:hypothetical protein
VPQIAVERSYLVINNTAYVIDWANKTQGFSSGLVDGSTISVSGRLNAIFYNKTAGSTYVVYYSKAKGLWKPQPGLQIENATLTTQSTTSTCTTTLTFTVSGAANGTWNLPMIPAGACYTVNGITQQSHTATMNLPSWATILASGSVTLLIGGTIGVLVKRRKAPAMENT